MESAYKVRSVKSSDYTMGHLDEAPFPSPIPINSCTRLFTPQMFMECLTCIGPWPGHRGFSREQDTAPALMEPVFQWRKPDNKQVNNSPAVRLALRAITVATGGSTIFHRAFQAQNSTVSFCLRIPVRELSTEKGNLVQGSFCFKPLRTEQNCPNHRITILILYHLVTLTRCWC